MMRSTISNSARGIDSETNSSLVSTVAMFYATTTMASTRRIAAMMFLVVVGVFGVVG